MASALMHLKRTVKLLFPSKRITADQLLRCAIKLLNGLILSTIWATILAAANEIQQSCSRSRELYAHANMGLSRFKSCSWDVKLYIFKPYLSNIYCISLWSPVKKQALRAVRVAYNHAFRILFGYPKMCSASENQVLDSNGTRLRAVMSLLRRLNNSDHPILQDILNSRMLINSSLYQSWRELLLQLIGGSWYNVLCLMYVIPLHISQIINDFFGFDLIANDIKMECGNEAYPLGAHIKQGSVDSHTK